MVENCDSVSDAAHEPALFAMLERGAPLLLTGRGAPAAGRSALPDLASRFRALVAFELGGADEALLMALAVKLFADRQVQVPEAVVTHLVQQPGTVAGRAPGFHRPGRCHGAEPAETHKSSINTGTYGGLTDISS